MLNTTERQILTEVCEEMMRGMPKCSKHEWRHKEREREKNVGGLLSRIRLLSSGLMVGQWAFVRWAFVPLPGQIYSKEKLTNFLSRREPELFSFSFSPWTLFYQGLSVRVRVAYSISSVVLDPFTQLLMTLTL